MSEVTEKRALSLVQALRSPRLDFTALALRDKKVGFGKSHQRIDDMVATLETEEQQDDDIKKILCSFFRQASPCGG